jgi:AICAR transformylase/IMP cyclohydrolase PurH
MFQDGAKEWKVIGCGSIRDQQVIGTCNKYGIAMAFCGLRLFHH